MVACYEFLFCPVQSTGNPDSSLSLNAADYPINDRNKIESYCKNGNNNIHIDLEGNEVKDDLESAKQEEFRSQLGKLIYKETVNFKNMEEKKEFIRNLNRLILNPTLNPTVQLPNDEDSSGVGSS